MSGQNKGVQARIKASCPHADYFHCTNHKVNLVARDAATTQPVARLLAPVQKVIVYLSESAKGSGVLHQAISDIAPESRRKRITQICPTQWVERHKSLDSFKELLPSIVVALQRLEQAENDTTALDMLNGLCTFESVICLEKATLITASLEFLSVYLQGLSVDLVRA
uniref:Transposase n=1 Tax=Romanomermis culicivorax TaxID=13658 RepID=A0A915HJ21_ROMCU